MKSNLQKHIDYYLSLNYEIVIRKMTRTEAGTSESRYIAQIPLIDGLMAEGETPQEALANLEIVKRLAFELMLKQGKEIPEPVFAGDTELAA
jgi:predicted RNase H-like HicB family nuclease